MRPVFALVLALVFLAACGRGPGDERPPEPGAENVAGRA